MPQPNGYRKAMRFMRHADKFGLPIITIVDTPGAYAGKAAEELGQVRAWVQEKWRGQASRQLAAYTGVLGACRQSAASLVLHTAAFWEPTHRSCADCSSC
jgi:hypothetical protein